MPPYYYVAITSYLIPLDMSTFIWAAPSQVICKVYWCTCVCFGREGGDATALGWLTKH
jgi:hypothetical protein